jgi:hypothetical protein
MIIPFKGKGIKIIPILSLYVIYFKDLQKYKKSSNVNIKTADLKPMLFDKIASQPFDNQYFHQGLWSFNKIKNSNTPLHIDVGGQINLIGYLSTITNVEYVDIRSLHINWPSFKFNKGTILQLPYKENSVYSLSCLHVAEHIGLGRYGDPIDLEGTEKACKELFRVLAKGGNLYFSVPIGIEKTCFNAHRIFSPNTVLQMFNGLTLESFASVDDHGIFEHDSDIRNFDKANYSLGLFHFKR